MTKPAIKAIAPAHQSETDTAWHVYSALAQYRAQNPQLAENIFYTEVMRDAHCFWAMLFGTRG